MRLNLTFITLICLMLGTSVFGQVKSISLGKDFSKIKVSNGLFVEVITDAEENKVEIKGSERDAVNVEVKNGELQLGLPMGKLFTEAEILITVYTQEVDELKVRNGSEVEFISTVNQKRISLIASEGSYIGGKLEVKKLEVKSVTGASISLVGLAEKSSVEVKTGASFDGETLKTETTDVKLSFGGEAHVYATEKCNANVNAGGNITIYGSPNHLSQKVTIGGNIDVVE